ncbi:MAG: DNA helicase RecQ [Bacteroidales bacterium]|uniref:DNA helicase RecQ n=1 Tax=Porphyromonas sp. TaxID=1924944 RepID=UPI002977EA81|nr:DNA helicase RecQ [Porphyromonas sp.]MDD7437747.1 DNA helicase RecQ [Bacteroidales bacterium]MDY3066584.1 DNA helicase RecQ [Porphyromonas sp.]
MDTRRKERLFQVLKQFFGFDAFKDQQLDIINSILDGKDTFVLMPTGGGKSLCFQLPALVSEGTAVIISPLIALMKNQVDALRANASDERIVHFMNSSLTKAQLDKVHDDLREGVTKMLYVAPESLTKAENVELLRNIQVSFYAVDEAHCISEWGHDFRPEYRRIREIVEEIMVRPIIALTATATPVVQEDIIKSLCMVEPNIFMSSFNRPNLYYEVRLKKEDIDKDIIKFIKSHPNKTGIVYCMSRNKVEQFAEVLQANGIKAMAYHAGMESCVRDQVQDSFISEDIDVIVATIAFGMGIDKPDVRYVIHYDIPKSLESYYQETGRAGRDGGEGKCIAYYSGEDIQKMSKLLQSKNKSNNEREVGRQLLDEISGYASSPICRRKYILHYFGEKYEQDNCHNCDNCLSNRKTVEAKEELISILQTVKELKEEFKAEYIINFVKGRVTADIENYKHNQLEEFGNCSEVDKEILETIIRQALIEGYLEKDVERFGVLKLTKQGKSFMRNPKSFKIQVEDDEEANDEGKSGATVGSGIADPQLFAILKDLRKKLAKQLDLPPYVIFQDASMQDMATFYPINESELQNISGVGLSKAKKFGKPFLELIGEYVRENEIERPEDIRIKTIPNRSKLKVSIVQLIDRKVSLEDIANTHDLDFGELLSELEAIVYSGTKININYFISDVMEEEAIDDIFDYFKHSTTDDIETAMSQLEVYEEDEIRLIRVKFIAEMAN